MSSSESEMENARRCGCEGVDVPDAEGAEEGVVGKKTCRGTEAFQKWKEEILSTDCKGGGKGKGRGGGKKPEVDRNCEVYRTMGKKQPQSSKSGCSCCSLFFCAAALVAAGVTVAFIKKKYID